MKGLPKVMETIPECIKREDTAAQIDLFPRPQALPSGWLLCFIWDVLEVQHLSRGQRALPRTQPSGVPCAFSSGMPSQSASQGYMWDMKASLPSPNADKSFFNLGQVYFPSSLSLCIGLKFPLTFKICLPWKTETKVRKCCYQPCGRQGE